MVQPLLRIAYPQVNMPGSAEFRLLEAVGPNGIRYEASMHHSSESGTDVIEKGVGVEGLLCTVTVLCCCLTRVRAPFQY